MYIRIFLLLHPSPSESSKGKTDASFQVAIQENAVARLWHGQGRHEEDAEEVAAEWIPIESNRANGWAEVVQEEERETRLATDGESKFSGQGRENHENLLPPDDRGGLVKAAGHVDDVQTIATTAAEARAAPEVSQRRRGGVHLRRDEDERREADEDACVPSRRLLREHDVGRRLVGLGQAEDRKEEAKEEEAATEKTDDEQRDRTKQARLQRKEWSLFVNVTTIIFFEWSAGRTIICRHLRSRTI